jgi:predicted Zn finger-like uncharacterized protein
MQLTCPNCQASYDVPDGAIGAKGRKVRCRACDTSWFESGSAHAAIPASAAPLPPPPIAMTVSPAAAGALSAPAMVEEPQQDVRRRRKGPWLLLALVVAVVALGAAVMLIVSTPDQVAARLGIGDRHVPLGISITREPDWRTIGGGSQLFAVSGRIWNPTGERQSVPDIRAELKDAGGKTVYSWTITRPVATLAPGQAVTFDGAAVDVPASSSKVNVTFAGSDGAS